MALVFDSSSHSAILDRMINPRPKSVMSVCPINELRSLFFERGDLSYLDTTRHVEHALQCATLAEREGSPAWLVTAALAHDIGYLLVSNTEPEDAQAESDQHHETGARWLDARFDRRVGLLVAAHVDAKRYLCTTEPGYMRALPMTCLRSLALQGGPMSSAEVERFDTGPLAKEALRLCRWDDRARRGGADGTRLEHFLSIARLAIQPALRGWS